MIGEVVAGQHLDEVVFARQVRGADRHDLAVAGRQSQAAARGRSSRSATSAAPPARPVRASSVSVALATTEAIAPSSPPIARLIVASDSLLRHRARASRGALTRR